MDSSRRTWCGEIAAAVATPVWQSPRRRRAKVRQVLGVIMLVAAAMGPQQAANADHDEDLHSNMSRIGNLDIGQTSDLAFWGNTAIVGHNVYNGDDRSKDGADDGFVVVDISDPAAPRQISEFQCVLSSYDVSVWDTLVFVSQDDSSGPEGSDSTGCASPPNKSGQRGAFAGIRIFSIADPAHPKPIAAIPTNCYKPDYKLPCPTGSHTHTLLPKLDYRDPTTGRPDPRLYVYANGQNTTIVKVPLRNPAGASVVDDSVNTAPSPGCHDLNILVSKNLAVCAGITETQLWDLSKPEAPFVMSHIENPSFQHHHSGVFSLDGNTLALSEERFEGAADLPVCYGGDVLFGSLRFYDISNPKLPVLRGHFQIPQDVADQVGRTCFGHYASVVPLRSKRDVLTVAWSGAGTFVVDFTDPADPKQLGYYVHDPLLPWEVAWSAYWYNGHIYTTHGRPHRIGTRGLDVLQIANPIFDRAVSLEHLNPQTQEPLPSEKFVEPTSDGLPEMPVPEVPLPE